MLGPGLVTGLLVFAGVAHLIGQWLRRREATREPGFQLGAVLGLGSALLTLLLALIMVTDPTRLFAPAGLWAAAASMVMIANHRFSPKMAGSVSLLIGAIGGAFLLAALLLSGAPREAILGVGVGIAPILALCQVAMLAGGGAFALGAIACAGEDETLAAGAWPAFGLVVAALVWGAAAGVGGLPWQSGALPLSTASGAPLDIHLSVSTLQGQQQLTRELATLFKVAPDLSGYLALAAGCLAILGGALTHQRSLRAVGGALLGLSGVAALVLGVTLIMSAGPVDAPGLDERLAVAEAFKVDTSPLKKSIQETGGSTPSPQQVLRAAVNEGAVGAVLTSPPTLSDEGARVHMADVLPAGIACLVGALLGLYGGWRRLSGSAELSRGLRRWPGGGHQIEGHFAPGYRLIASRDAMMMAAVTLWVAAALGALTSFELYGRHTPDHRVGVIFALGLLAVASVRGWHAALGRGTQAAFNAWLLMPCLVLLVGSWTVLSGLFAAEPFSLLWILR